MEELMEELTEGTTEGTTEGKTTKAKTKSGPSTRSGNAAAWYVLYKRANRGLSG
jgi:hypothetical protein